MACGWLQRPRPVGVPHTKIVLVAFSQSGTKTIPTCRRSMLEWLLAINCCRQPRFVSDGCRMKFHDRGYRSQGAKEPGPGPFLSVVSFFLGRSICGWGDPQVTPSLLRLPAIPVSSLEFLYIPTHIFIHPFAPLKLPHPSSPQSHP